jgi:hypothetical protein
MACELELDGTIATIKVEFAVRRRDGVEVSSSEFLETVVYYADDELREELAGIARRAFTREVDVRPVSFSGGSVIASVVLVGTIVIETGAFLAGLREIRQAVQGPIGRFIERRALRTGTQISAEPMDTNIVIGGGLLNAGVKQPGQPAAATSDRSGRSAGTLGEPTIVILASAALVLLIIIALLLAADAGR